MAKYVFVTGGVTSSLGQGHHRRQHRPPAQGPRPRRLRPEARPVHQRRPGDDVALPARRGLRHRRRRRDGPGPGPLRAVHRREPLPALQRHDRPHLPGRHRQGAPRRLPGRHGPGHPAHHQRDQGADPARGPRRPRRRRHRRGRRHGRRHRVAAVPRGHPPDAQGRRPPERASTSTSRCCPPWRRRASSRPSPPSTPSRSCAASASSPTSSSCARTTRSAEEIRDKIALFTDVASEAVIPAETAVDDLRGAAPVRGVRPRRRCWCASSGLAEHGAARRTSRPGASWSS